MILWVNDILPQLFCLICTNSGSRSATIVNNMTVEIVVTDAVNDGDFARLRQVMEIPQTYCNLHT